MTKHEFQKTMAFMSQYYPSVEEGEEMWKAYWLRFKDCDKDTFAKACGKAIDESEFYPTVARLIKNMSCDITLDKVTKELSWVISLPPGQSFSSTKDIHPVTKTILHKLGGKMSIGSMDSEKLRISITREYKYAIVGLVDDKPKIGARSGKTNIGESVFGIIRETK
tara:strand:+ start:8365 stop:8862 length:498 start_codon:yes stop_codon:yes gene_type:complete